MGGVVGLGYVGLPIAVEKANVGYHVLGIDRNVGRTAQVNEGRNYIGDVHDDELRELTMGMGLIKATTDFSQLAQMDAIVICVPTPLTKNLVPDLQYIEAVTREIANNLRPGQLVSLEGTAYPGTTDEVMKPILKAGEDFFLAHSPERVDPGNARYTTKNTNKVVGASDPASLKVALALYRQTILHVVPATSAKAAEMVKVFENTYRAVNFALVGQEPRAHLPRTGDPGRGGGALPGPAGEGQGGLPRRARVGPPGGGPTSARPTPPSCKCHTGCSPEIWEAEVAKHQLSWRLG